MVDIGMYSLQVVQSPVKSSPLPDLSSLGLRGPYRHIKHKYADKIYTW